MLADGDIASPVEIAGAAARVRKARIKMLARFGAAGLQNRAVDSISRLGQAWSDPDFEPRVRAYRAPGVFPFGMVQVSLDGLLGSLTADSLRRLIDSESCSGLMGPNVIGHVIASNTPLLGWTSAIRALLVGSGSMIKAPTSANAAWIDYFIDSLRIVDEELADLVSVLGWKGGAGEQDRALADSVDLLVVYGDDETMVSWRNLAGNKVPVAGYGHRVSAGFVLDDADLAATAEGVAIDVLMYDLGGCLSPQAIFVEGAAARAAQFGSSLASALGRCKLPYARGNAARSARVREARQVAQFERGVGVKGSDDLAWTVVVSAGLLWPAWSAESVVTVVPFEISEIGEIYKFHPTLWQGALISTKNVEKYRWLANNLCKHGFSYICEPGYMQRPLISWRENNIDVLGSLIIR